MNKTGRLRLAAGLILILSFGCAAFALFFSTAAPARAFLFAATTPTQENLWAQVNVAKPVSTATPIVPTVEPPTATSIPSETPVVFSMEIVNSASSPIQPAPDQAQVLPQVVTTNGSKHILVDISEQHLYAYYNNTLVFSFVASTGINNATRVGTFAVQTKLDNAYGVTWNIWMPNWLGIYYSGSLENGIHALPILSNGATLWEGFLGRPVSYGCVVLGTGESKLLYDWADMGTTVEIQW